MEKDIITGLTSGDDRYACGLADKIISESQYTDEWYSRFDDFASMLDHPKSLVRNRAINILAANARWDSENRFDSILHKFLSHVTDEKQITARQCIKSLAQVGRARPRYIPEILAALSNAELSKYKDSMQPLLRKDIEVTMDQLTKFRI